MGLTTRVLFPDTPVSWVKLSELLATRGFLAELRMIDGQLALPAEDPGDRWHELRVNTPAGMMTLRREPDGMSIVTWGNAGDDLKQAACAFAWALASVTGGSALLDGQPHDAAAIPLLRLPPSFHAATGA